MVQRERKVKTSVAAGTKKKSAGKRRTTTRRKRSKKKGGGLTAWLRSLMPGWAWWVGVALVVGFCYLVVHNFLYQPDCSATKASYVTILSALCLSRRRRATSG